MTEIWLPVLGYEGLYEISEYGRVRSLDRITVKKDGSQQRSRGQLLTPYRTETPGRVTYYRVGLTKDGHQRSIRLHVLVLEAFVGPRPDGFVGCHCDGDYANNHYSNLRWDSYSANNHELVTHGRHHYARRDTCTQGHRYTPENTITRSDGGRKCRICQRAANRESYARRGRAA